MGKVLDAATIEQFHRDGFYAPVQVTTSAEALQMRDCLEAYEAEHGGPLKGSVRFKSHLLFKWLADFIRSPSVLDPVEDVIGPDIMVWSTDWWLKEANSPSYVSWHQDSQYWGLDSQKLVTVWVALSPSNVASGCMRYMPGSHLGPDLPHRETYHDDNLLTPRAGDHRRHRRVQGGERRARAGRGFDLRVPHRARIASQPHRRPPHRACGPLHTARCTSGPLGSGQRGTRARGRHARPLRARAEPECDFDPNVVEFHRWAGGGATQDPLPRHRLDDAPHLNSGRRPAQ